MPSKTGPSFKLVRVRLGRNREVRMKRNRFTVDAIIRMLRESISPTGWLFNFHLVGCLWSDPGRERLNDPTTGP